MSTATRTPARERLLAAADELFYAEGIQTVGIDRIIERAGVAKASLYNTFGSKEELVHAYLEGRRARLLARYDTEMAKQDSPRGKILAVFDAQARFAASAGYHGCAFARASAEATPGGRVLEAVSHYRADLRGLFARLGAEAGAQDPEALADQLQLVYDGAHMATYLRAPQTDPQLTPERVGATRRAVEILLEAALA